MLFVQTQLQSFFPISVKRQEVEIIIGAPMKHPATAINGGVDERAGRAGVFGLHVILMSAALTFVLCPKIMVLGSENTCQ